MILFHCDNIVNLRGVTMTEENFVEEDIKKRLILAGIRELDEHGTGDFSLRRVAQASGVSCAAPYRHFKSRDDLISEIIKYINSSWDLLFDELRLAFGDDTYRLIKELAISTVGFFAANANYRSVMISGLSLSSEKRSKEISHVCDKLEGLVAYYCKNNGIKSADELAFSLCTAVWGAVILLDPDDKDSCTRASENMGKTVEMIFEKDNY